MLKTRVFQFAKYFFYGTIVSRFFGMLRDILMAFYFGSSSVVASFMVAYRLANLFRRLFGEGTVNAGFVPHFEALKSVNKAQGYKFYRDLLFSLSLMLIILIISAELVLSALNPSYEIKMIINYVMIMLLGLIFVCLYALNMAFLNCHKKFFLPAVAPVIFNLIWIIAIFLGRNYQMNTQMIILSCFVVVGYLMQFLFTHFQAQMIYRKFSPKVKWHFPTFFSKDVKSMLKPLTYSIIGVGAIQINSAVDAIFAKAASSSGPAYLWYAIRLQQLPFALFSIAVATAILPLLSKSLQSKNFKLFQDHFKRGVLLSFTLMMISSFAIFSMGDLLINLIYGRGSFSNIDILKTFNCLRAYGIGLIPQTLVLIIANCFYAKKDYKTPALTSLNTVAFNIFLNSFFVFYLKMGAFSIALATSISAFLNLALLKACLNKIHPMRVFQFSFLKIALVSFLSYEATNISRKVLFLKDFYPNNFLTQITQLITLAGIFVLGILVFAKFFKVDEIYNLVKKGPFNAKRGSRT